MQNFCGLLKDGLLFGAEGGDLSCESLDAAGSAFHEEFFAWGRCQELGAATVVCVLLFEDETLLFEGVDDAGHGGWAHLLGGGQVAEGDGAAEDDNGEGG